jgi:hypothetical protein
MQQSLPMQSLNLIQIYLYIAPFRLSTPFHIILHKSRLPILKQILAAENHAWILTFSAALCTISVPPLLARLQTQRLLANYL